MSFQIYSPFDDQNLLEGLCGSFDGNANNDINVRGSGKYYQLNNLWTDYGPNDYMESWRLVIYVEVHGVDISRHESEVE